MADMTMTGVLSDAAKSKSEKFDFGEAAGAMQGASTWSPSDNAMTSSQLNKLLSSDSPMLKLARSRASAVASKRGLLASSIAAGAGEEAAIKSATPIAQSDAATWADSEKFNASAANDFARDSNAFGRATAMERFRGVLSEEADLRGFAQRDKEQTADQGFRAGESALEREARLREQQADQTFRSGQADIDRTARESEFNRDLSFRTDSSAKDLAFRTDNAAKDYSLRDQARIDTNTNAAADRALKEKSLEAERLQRESTARQQMASDISSIQRQAIDARTRLEADPNMTASAKQSAILALANQAAADIESYVKFSGISLPDTWAGWINNFVRSDGSGSTGTASGPTYGGGWKFSGDWMGNGEAPPLDPERDRP